MTEEKKLTYVELAAKVDTLTAELDALKKGDEEPEVKLVKIYWDHPVVSLDGSTPSAYGFNLIETDAGYHSMVPENRVKDLCDRTPGYATELTVPADEE